MTDLKKYIAINHYFMTVPEMSRETGEPDGRIRYIMKQNNWEVLKPNDRIKEYIKEHPGSILEDVAEKFDTDRDYIRRLGNEAGLKLTTRKQAGIVKEDPVIEEKPKYSLMHIAFYESEKQEYMEGKAMVMTGPRKRLREAYSQGGSPYGLADKVWRKKLK